MSILKTEAIVLKKRDFRETSIITDFYTRDFGKVTGILKGIRKEPSKFASTLELFSNNEIIFYRKRNSSIHLISQCDTRSNFDSVRKDIIKTGIGNVMIELVGAVMASEEKNEEIFDLTLACLNELAITSQPNKVVTIFKIKMLALSGFKPHFDSCVSCGNKILEQTKFSLMLGGLLCRKCYSKDTSARTIYRGTIASILHIERNEFRNNLNLGMNPQIKRELELILKAFLNYHLERDLKSERVLNRLTVPAYLGG